MRHRTTPVSSVSFICSNEPLFTRSQPKGCVQPFNGGDGWHGSSLTRAEVPKNDQKLKKRHGAAQENRPMKIKVEIVEEGQSSTSIEFEADEAALCREKAVQFLEAFPISSGTQPQAETQKQGTGTRAEIGSGGVSDDIPDLSGMNEDLTLKERLKMFLRHECSGEWFSSREAKHAYDEAYGDDLALSTVSTYLSRMYRDDILERRGSRSEREYRVKNPPESPATGVGDTPGISQRE